MSTYRSACEAVPIPCDLSYFTIIEDRFSGICTPPTVRQGIEAALEVGGIFKSNTFKYDFDGISVASRWLWLYTRMKRPFGDVTYAYLLRKSALGGPLI